MPLTWWFWVELRGFEPLTPSMRTRCATGLRYSPKTGCQRSKRSGYARQHEVVICRRASIAGLADATADTDQSPTARTAASAYWS
jgi:hypothetical protein